LPDFADELALLPDDLVGDDHDDFNDDDDDGQHHEQGDIDAGTGVPTLSGRHVLLLLHLVGCQVWGHEKIGQLLKRCSKI
jgi:hypothetical protein